MYFFGKFIVVYLFLLILILGQFTVECWASETRGSGQGVMRRVLWTVAAYHITPTAKWGEDQANEMIFKPLDITPSSIYFDDRSCHGVTFHYQVVDTVDYFNEKYQTFPQSLNIKDKTIKVITTNCQLDGFSEYIRLGDRRLIVTINGVLFIFNPKLSY
ncbi:MAG: hypothetical protein OEM02_16030 [Desulfobulbaceae bacterium]|nr:hypothetical protein [Desulfobulbaceae bacterium]